MEEENSISALTFTFDSLRLRLIFRRATFYLKPHLAKRLVAPRLLVDHQCLGNFLIHQFTRHPASPSIVCLNFAPIAENQFFIFLNLIFFPIYFLLLLIVYFNFFFSECHPCVLTEISPLSSVFQLTHCLFEFVSFFLWICTFLTPSVFQANFFIILSFQQTFFIILSFKQAFSFLADDCSRAAEPRNFPQRSVFPQMGNNAAHSFFHFVPFLSLSFSF